MGKSRWFVLIVLMTSVATACSRSGPTSSTAAAPTSTTTTAPAAGTNCSSEPLKATEVGVTDKDITVEVSADTGSPLAPGLFQGDVDAMLAFAKYVNANGGIACRRLVVRTWDSHLSPAESKNGAIDGCKNALAMVGGNSLFNPDMSPYDSCAGQAGAVTGLPDIAALANDLNEQCDWKLVFMIQAVSEHCPVVTGRPRVLTSMVGPAKWYLSQVPGLHGLYMVPGDLPTTVQSATYQIAAQASAGLKWDATLKVSGSDPQVAYTVLVQNIKANKSNLVYDGANDQAMINMRKEARAQGIDSSIKIWACSAACYTKNFLSQGGSGVEGTYLWMSFLPFEEADQNGEVTAFLDNVGAGKADAFGANAWQAGVLFKQVVDQIVKEGGPNAITRAKLLEGLNQVKNFDANGWMGPKDLHGTSPCFLVMQVQGGKFVRVYPTQKGTMDCAPSNLATVTLDPAAEAAKIR